MGLYHAAAHVAWQRQSKARPGYMVPVRPSIVVIQEKKSGETEPLEQGLLRHTQPVGVLGVAP